MSDSADRHAPPPYLLKGQIPSLNGLRALAIIQVLLAHACQTQGFPHAEIARKIFVRGEIGVQIFFVLSGFLITTLMVREIDRQGRLGIRTFYLRRMLRIVPAYACFLLAVAILVLIGQSHLHWPDWAAALTYTVNFLQRPTWEIGHVWSLSIEEHFYLLWPLVMGIGRPQTARRVAMSVIAGAFILRWTIMLAMPRYASVAELWTFTRLDGIAFGCLLALLVQDTTWRQWLDAVCERTAWLWLAGAALLASVWMSDVSGKYAVGLSFTVNSTAIAVLMWAAIKRRESLVGRVLNGQMLSAIGVVSYSLYLWQQIFLNRYKTGFLYGFPQNLLFACLAAAFSYWLIERPFLRLKDRLGQWPLTAARTYTIPKSLPSPAGTLRSGHTSESIAPV